MRTIPTSIVESSFEYPAVCIFALKALSGVNRTASRALDVTRGMHIVPVMVDEWVTAQDLGMKESPSIAVVSRGKVVDILSGEQTTATIRKWLVATCASQQSLLSRCGVRFENTGRFEGYP